MKVVVTALVMLVVVPARAEPSDARDHFNKGNVAFDLGNYEQAAAEFKQAYALSGKPQLLFNLAQAYRYQKDYEQALHAYERYLDLQPDAPNREDVERFEEQVRAAIAEEAQRRAGEKAVMAAPIPQPAASERFAHTRRGRLTLGLVGLAGGLLAVSAVTGGVSLGARKDYDAGCDRGACDAAAYDRGRALAITTDVLVAFGVASAVAALVVAVVRPHRAGARPITLGMVF